MPRQRSIKKGPDDDRSVRNGRVRGVGTCIEDEWQQHIPMFFTREIAEVQLTGHYKGGSIFFICNGPSLNDYDLSKLNQPGIVTFGINNGPAVFRPDFWSCVDGPERFLYSIWMDPKITKIVPITHMENSFWNPKTKNKTKMKVGECPNVIGFRRNEKFIPDRWLKEDTFNWGNHKDHGGGRSVMLSSIRIMYELGFRRIYIIGSDFNMSKDYTYAFNEQRHKGAVNCNMNTYDKMNNEYWPALAPIFEEAGLQVFNCNEKSQLTAFPYISYDNAIEECTAKLGDWENEETFGMYSKIEDKKKWKAEPKGKAPDTNKPVQHNTKGTRNLAQELRDKTKQGQPDSPVPLTPPTPQPPQPPQPQPQQPPKNSNAHKVAQNGNSQHARDLKKAVEQSLNGDDALAKKGKAIVPNEPPQPQQPQVIQAKIEGGRIINKSDLKENVGRDQQSSSSEDDLPKVKNPSQQLPPHIILPDA